MCGVSAAQQPEPTRPSATDWNHSGLEPVPNWAGDAETARRFGSPRQIRSVLLPEQVEAFEAEFDAALSTAHQTLHLGQLHHMLRMWRRQALMTERDPEGHRRMLATAAEVQRSGNPRSGSVPWSVLKAELGL